MDPLPTSFLSQCEVLPGSVALSKAHFPSQATKDKESPGGNFGPRCDLTFERNRQNRQSFCCFLFVKEIYLDIILTACNSLI